MGVGVAARRITYRSVRLWPDRRAAANIEVERAGAARVNELEVFLTARYRLYTIIAGRLMAADVEHAPWPLEEARLLRLDQTLTDAAGLGSASNAPLVHFSPGVHVVGPPHTLS
jgi:uncharacterized protein YqjF (DUF2071 family)